MALTDSSNPVNAQPNTQRSDRAPSEAGLGNRKAVPHDYLARLPALHAEAARNTRLGGFLARSAQAAGLLMAAGAATLLAGGGTLQSDFVWSVLVLAGVGAMTVNYIRGQANSLHRVKLEVAAADLRAALLYTGFAWGAGAFLALPAAPGLALALGFAAGPSLLLALLLKDEAGIAAFAAPAAALAAAAALFKHWPGSQVIVPAVLAAATAIIVFSCLHKGRARLHSGQHGTA